MANEDDEYKAFMKRMEPIHRMEEDAVRALCEQLGYGRVMQLAEQTWREKSIAENFKGSEHTVGPCAAFMVRCPHHDDDFPGWLDANGHCDWCCGAGRVTQRVAKAMMEMKG
jgi:hypothetical protein